MALNKEEFYAMCEMLMSYGTAAYKMPLQAHKMAQNMRNADPEQEAQLWLKTQKMLGTDPPEDIKIICDFCWRAVQ